MKRRPKTQPWRKNATPQPKARRVRILPPTAAELEELGELEAAREEWQPDSSVRELTPAQIDADIV